MSLRPVGGTCSFSSIRDNDKRSEINRLMRPACACITSKNCSRAFVSLRAGPRRVSIKPIMAAKGVRSSWLALAKKSARIRSDILASVSSKIDTNTYWTPAASNAATDTRSNRSTGTRVSIERLRDMPSTRTVSTASIRSGRRTTLLKRTELSPIENRALAA